MKHDEILKANRRVYQRMAAAKDPLCRPATDQELASPLRTVDGSGWLGASIAGQNVLCLAAGGGRQSSLYAAAGASVTVVDLSGAMLELDRQVAAERGYSLRLLETSMEDLSGISSGEIDIVIHPVSTCYIPDLAPVYAEVARVTRVGGLYISQHKQPTSLQSDLDPNVSGNFEIKHAYYRSDPVPAPTTTSKNARRLRETGAVEFLHRWEEIVGSMCKSGFVIEDLSEPMHASNDAVFGSFAHRARFIPPYVRIKAKRVDSGRVASAQKTLWMPDA